MVGITSGKIELSHNCRSKSIESFGTTDQAFTYTAAGFEGGDDDKILAGVLSRATGGITNLFMRLLKTIDTRTSTQEMLSSGL
jgi:hypothetical protein